MSTCALASSNIEKSIFDDIVVLPDVIKIFVMSIDVLIFCQVSSKSTKYS